MVLRSLESWSPPDPNLPDEGGGSDVFLRGSTPAPVELPTTEQEYAVAVWVLSALLVVLSIVLVAVVFHIICHHRRLRSSMTLFPRRRQKALEERITRRYETIEGWIISKRVQEHTTFCGTCVRDFSTFDEDTWIEKNTTLDTADDSRAASDLSADGSDEAQVAAEGRSTATSTVPSAPVTTPVADHSEQSTDQECPICFDDLLPGQVISYSANPACNHVFHHQCIKEWLVHHVTCPFCRKVCMHVDEYRGKQKHEHIEELLELHSKRSATTFFCQQEGLVTIPSRIRCTNSELKLLQKRICDCIVDRKELATLRGSRPTTGSIVEATEGTLDVEQPIMPQAAVEAPVEGSQDDYDPTENEDEDLVIFAQGQGTSINEQVTVERVLSMDEGDAAEETAVEDGRR